jgi:uncharacterized protein (TIGR02246 family)
MSSYTRWSAWSARAAVIAVAIALPGATGHAQQNDAATIRALSNQWQQYVSAQDIDRLNALFTPDAVMMLSHAPLVNGGTAVRAAWADLVKTPGLVVHWTPTKIDVASPTVATEYGTYTESYDSPQGKMTDSGNYVTIWHKINGKWLVALDAPNTTAPLPEPAAAPMDPSTMETHSAGELSWSDLTAPGFAPGAKIAVLHGNPMGPGGFVLRLQFPDSYEIPVHWHPTGENVTVVSGSVALGMGNAFDPSALRTYGVGDFAYLPPHQSHFGRTRGTTIVQVNGRGPFVINPGPPR